MCCGCAAPTEGPGKAAVDYLNAVAERDGEAVWAMLTPETHTRLASLFGTLRKTRSLVLEHYPEASRKEALAASGAGIVADVPDPKGLFLRLFTGAGEAAEKTTMHRFGVRPRRTEPGTDGRTVVTSWGGDAVTVVEIGGAWRVTLNAEDSSRLEKLEATAERNHGRIAKAVQGITSKRFR